jgi:hypothetical protein
MTTKTVHQVLVEAKALIEDKAHWTQLYYATAANGRAVDANNENATCFCSVGAVYRVLDLNENMSPPEIWRTPHPNAIAALNRAAMELFEGNCGIVMVNDRNGHEAVMQVFDRAIQATKEAQ